VRIVVILSIRRDGFPALSTHTTSVELEETQIHEEALSTDSASHARSDRDGSAGVAEEPDDRAHPWCGCPVSSSSASSRPFDDAFRVTHPREQRMQWI